MTPTEKALAALKVSEGNILSCWHAAGREVYAPYTEWLCLVRDAIAEIERGKKDVDATR